KGLSPARLFDPAYYVSQLSDRLPDGADPLSHYLRGGPRVSVSPHPNFNTRFYLENAPGGRSALNPLVHYQTLGRSKGARTTRAFSLENDVDTLRAMRAWRGDHPLLLMINHYGGGGTGKHVRELAAAVGSRCKVLLLYPVHGESMLRLTTLDAQVTLQLDFDRPRQLDAVIDVLRHLHIDRIHVHHLFGHED